MPWQGYARWEVLQAQAAISLCDFMSFTFIGLFFCSWQIPKPQLRQVYSTQPSNLWLPFKALKSCKESLKVPSPSQLYFLYISPPWSDILVTQCILSYCIWHVHVWIGLSQHCLHYIPSNYIHSSSGNQYTCQDVTYPKNTGCEVDTLVHTKE